MTDLLREVDDMMRQERLEKFWRENGNWIIGTIVLIILSTAAFSIYKGWRHHVRTTQTTLLIEALENENFSQEAANLTQDLSGKMKAVALLIAGGRALEAKNSELALQHYKSAADLGNQAGEYYAPAVIMSARLDQDANKTGHLPALQKVAGDRKNPWRYHAFLEAAVIAAAYNNDFTAARAYLENILVNPDPALPVPQGLAERAGALDHVYAMKQKAAAPAKQEG